MKIDIDRSKKKVVSSLSGSIDSHTLIALKESLEKVVAGNDIHIVEVEISGITNLDSLNLGEFMRIKKWLQDNGIIFKLLNPTGKVRFLIETASFEPFLLDGEDY